MSSSNTSFVFEVVTLLRALGDGEFDAADIDRELISARLKQDVLDNSGKVHLFIADSVRDIFFFY